MADGTGAGTCFGTPAMMLHAASMKIAGFNCLIWPSRGHWQFRRLRPDLIRDSRVYHSERGGRSINSTMASRGASPSNSTR